MVKQWKPLRNSQSKKMNFFVVPQSLPGVVPLTKKPEDSGYEIETVQLLIFRFAV